MKHKCVRYLQRKESIYMAINESILGKIDELKIKKSEKKLLIDLLEQQEHGGRQYTKQYMEIINKYLESKKK